MVDSGLFLYDYDYSYLDDFIPSDLHSTFFILLYFIKILQNNKIKNVTLRFIQYYFYWLFVFSR